MNQEIPNWVAFDSDRNPLYKSDGNFAGAEEASRDKDLNLFLDGNILYSGPVYDKWNYRVRAGGEPFSGSWQSGGDFVDRAIENVVGSVVMVAIIGFLTWASGPIDRWLMKLAKEQTSRPDELEREIASISGLNISGFLGGPLWLLLFLRLRFALIVIVLPAVVFFIPLFGQLCLLIMYGLVLIRGNEWAWYSGKWATIDDLKTAKKRWVYAMLGLYAFLSLVSVLTN